MTQDLDALRARFPDEDSVFVIYSYRIRVEHKDKTDSDMVEGKKGTRITKDQKDLFFTDFVPIYLYPGCFIYVLDLWSETWLYSDTGIIDIAHNDTMNRSDLVLGKKCAPNTFVYHDHAFIPTIDGKFTLFDTLVSFCELYCLQPDSLYYEAQYEIRDNSATTVVFHRRSHLKYDYVQIDTFCFPLAPLVPGEYMFCLTMDDSIADFHGAFSKPFSIVELIDEHEGKPYYCDIQYLVSGNEYKDFAALDEQGKRLYLKKFWDAQSYEEFEKRISVADSLFSTRTMPGRDSERGRYYIVNGPPNEIEYYTMTWWGRDIELWRYQSQGKEVIFCDIHADANPRFIVELGVGEMMHILEYGYRDPSKEKKWPWLYDLAPGTYDVPGGPKE